MVLDFQYLNKCFQLNYFLTNLMKQTQLFSLFPLEFIVKSCRLRDQCFLEVITH